MALMETLLLKCFFFSLFSFCIYVCVSLSPMCSRPFFSLPCTILLPLKGERPSSARISTSEDNKRYSAAVARDFSTHTQGYAKSVAVVAVFAAYSARAPDSVLLCSCSTDIFFFFFSPFLFFMVTFSVDTLARAARKSPVTAAFASATLLIAFLDWLDVVDSMSFVLHSGSAESFPWYPWCLLTYVFVVPVFRLLYLPLYLALFAGWGGAVEAAIGSREYVTYSFFVVAVTAVLVMLVDRAVVSPLAYWTSDPRRDRPDLERALGTPNVGFYCYWGVWPLAQVIVFALCRVRGPTTPVGPSPLGRRLTLQQLPLALVGCAVVLCGLQSLLDTHVSFDTTSEYMVVFPLIWSWLIPLISMYAAWLYERHTSGTANLAFALDAFFYPAPVRSVVRRAGEATYGLLRPSKFSFLLPPREAGATTMPMPVFATATAAAATPDASPGSQGGRTLLPGTTAEEAERYRLIAREALARRLQEYQQTRLETAANVEETARVSAASLTPDAVLPSKSSDDKTA